MSNRVQKWNVGLERRKERETFCGRFRKRTPFLRLRAQLHRIRGRTLRTESLDRSNARDLAQVVRLLREVDVSPVSPSSTTQDVSNRVQKWNVGLERRKERETFCGRFRKRTPFLRLRAQLHRIRGRTIRFELNFAGYKHHLSITFYK